MAMHDEFSAHVELQGGAGPEAPCQQARGRRGAGGSVSAGARETRGRRLRVSRLQGGASDGCCPEFT